MNYHDGLGLCQMLPETTVCISTTVVGTSNGGPGGYGGEGPGPRPISEATGDRPVPGSQGGGGNLTAIVGLAHNAAIDLVFAGIRAAFMNATNSECEEWFNAAFMTSDNRAYGSLDNYLTALSTLSAAGAFSGGSANAVANSPLTPGTVIAVNTNGAFFNALPSGQTLAPSDDFASQFAAINGNSDRARVFIMLHETAHVLGMIRSNDGGRDEQSQANQRFNNDQIWRNCSGTINSFSNRPH